ncbi:SusC/RagA family TonB-linked outer membrane protein [Spirosoma endbachense]|uniref:SusC/RagA family TonB-linked outer membrane protein n=1 Tax=Spirosoma endbachense TaxID=2666025 RepID=A0A6P1VRH5_9BACT|nr:SusC/RagA family TonB-linked outer membrane protein [Spirosoma endbachense]QHV95683.1 SusC/RagA family TonB-linked outer membrane protein [Spirosoma endbachense]
MKQLLHRIAGLLLVSLFLQQICLSQRIAYVSQSLVNKSVNNQQSIVTMLRDVLVDLGRKYQVSIVFEESTVQGISVTVATEGKLERQLELLLKPYGLAYRKAGKGIYVIVRKETGKVSKAGFVNTANELPAPETNLSTQRDLAAEILPVSTSEERVTGKVSDEKGVGLPGVSVVLKGTQKGTVTGTDGRYELVIPDREATLIFSFIGYVPQEMIIGNRSVLDLTLKVDTKTLEEVIVVGYGTQIRRDVTSAVSSVSEKDFKGQPVTRLDQVLQGRVPGVQVTNSGGAPGGEVRIRVRGANSLSGDNDPLYVVDGFIGADFTTINPEDIASIEVLKDASATSIYGSRGANGVIIITTKTGKKGEMKVDFGVRYYSSTVLKKYNTLNAADFAQVANERVKALLPVGGTYVPKFTDSQIEGFRKSGGTDWQDEIFRTAPGKEIQLTLSGGNEKTSYLISGNFLNQDGIIKNTDFKRYSIRSNITSQLSKKFSLRFNFTGARRENHNTSGTSQRSGALSQALAWAPTTPVRDDKGNYVLFDPTSSLFSNPVAIINENEYRSENSSINMVGALRYEFIPGLSLDIQGGLNYLNSQGKAFQGYPSTRTWATAGRSSGENVTWQNTNTLNYSKVFNLSHKLNVTAVFETQKFTGTGFNANVANLTYPAQSYDNLALSASSTVGSGYSSWSLLSTLGRVNYSYKDRYLVSATVRRDGSSKFQGSNKFSTFPSVSLGWHMSEESFLKNQGIIDDLKIRTSWGLTGNQGIGSYGTLSSYVTNVDDAGVVFNGNGGPLVAGILLGNPGNVNLKWETTEQFNLGLDVEILKGKLRLSADYFVKNTRDLLMLRPLPGYIGGYSIQSNIGELQNKGWEFALNTTPVRSNGFEWTSTLNVALLKNKIVRLRTERDTIPLNENVLIPGQPMNAFWGYKYLGTWKANQADEAALSKLKPGDARYEDLDRNGVLNEKDQQVLGNGTPNVSIGFNNTFTYKNLSLNLFFQGLLGFDKLNYTYANGIMGSTDAKEITFADIRDRYIPGVNETSDIPAFSSASTNSLIQTSRFVEKGDFVRLKNVSLTYTLPKTLLKNIAAVRLFVSATNLLTFTKYKGIDPESNSNAVSGITWQNFGTDVQQGIDYGAYPNSKTYTAGINFSF